SKKRGQDVILHLEFLLWTQQKSMNKNKNDDENNSREWYALDNHALLELNFNQPISNQMRKI
ncbi:MAG TPA: hypothetical protein VE595_05575, partial [Nitrososphaeraceae archaeon]|nr:hypothetical protein [Nitrososphaeraceae archaeon]